MSTEISTHKGTYEIPIPNTFMSEYTEVDMTITTFWGGQKRGKSVQLTLSVNSGYIQFDNKTAKEFALSILDALSEDDANIPEDFGTHQYHDIG